MTVPEFIQETKLAAGRRAETLSGSIARSWFSGSFAAWYSGKMTHAYIIAWSNRERAAFPVQQHMLYTACPIGGQPVTELCSGLCCYEDICEAVCITGADLETVCLLNPKE